MVTTTIPSALLELLQYLSGREAHYRARYVNVLERGSYDDVAVCLLRETAEAYCARHAALETLLGLDTPPAGG